MAYMMTYRDWSGLTILLIEDEDDTTCLLEFVLQKHGYRVIHSNSGRHAKSLITTMAPPDAVLLDMQLPDTTGLDLLAYLRTQVLWQKIPVAMLAAHADSPDLQKAALLGANDHILKPVSPTRLATRLTCLLTHVSKKEARLM